MKTPKTKIILMTALFSVMWTTIAQAQTKKESSNSANQSKVESGSSGSNAGSDKLDLKKLEDRFWSAKDSDFSVVQNRTYTKARRYFATFSYGPLVNDAYSYGRMTNLAVGYYFNERWGLELASETGALTDNESTTTMSGRFGLKPNYNKFKNYTSINMAWVPLYAKMSFLDQSILYFDMQFALGLGQMTYEAQQEPTETSNVLKKGIGINFDITQQVFFHEHWSIRLDIKNKFTSQNLLNYKLSGSSTPYRDLGNVNQQDTTILLGVTYFH